MLIKKIGGAEGLGRSVKEKRCHNQHQNEERNRTQTHYFHRVFLLNLGTAYKNITRKTSGLVYVLGGRRS